jgi:hypothetical protein
MPQGFRGTAAALAFHKPATVGARARVRLSDVSENALCVPKTSSGEDFGSGG